MGQLNPKLLGAQSGRFEVEGQGLGFLVEAQGLRFRVHPKP